MKYIQIKHTVPTLNIGKRCEIVDVEKNANMTRWIFSIESATFYLGQSCRIPGRSIINREYF